MPWRETSPMEQRLDFVRDFETGLFTMTELATQYGVSRKTGYKWLAAYASGGATGLQDRSRRPHHSPHAIEDERVKIMLALRHRHPRWGPKKLLALARQRDAEAAWPARSTVARWLKAQGLVASPRRAAPPHAVRRSALAAPTRANEVWTTDFKGEFRTSDRLYCYPLTLRDGFSRFVLRCDALAARSDAVTRRRFERAFAEYGLPDRIRSDNGGPFAGPGLGRLSRLSVWWLRLGIGLERIALGRPEQNGSHEQFHRILKAETARPPAATRRAQQRRFDRFVDEYNHERPHEALADAVPASRYESSRRPLPTHVPPLDYPGHMEVRLVSSNGYVRWQNASVFLASPLAGEYVGFEEVDDGIWTVHFGTVPLARYDERAHALRAIVVADNEGRSAGCAGSAPDITNEKPE